jgi:integrating conjugative element protein (TIGR03755 family)
MRTFRSHLHGGFLRASRLWLIAFLSASTWVPAQTVISPNGTHVTGSTVNDQLLYTIGGGRAVASSHTANMQSLTVGIGWNANLICGNMSLTTTLHNQLNGITEGFHAIMSGLIQDATTAVASLPALIIQRADPGLYNLLTNGILQARLDYDRSKTACRAIANHLADLAQGEFGWDQLSEGLALRDAVGGNDAITAINTAESNHGNAGVPWIGGANAGGAGQPSIKVVGDVTRTGYNLLNGRAINDATSITPAACNNGLTCRAWPSPGAAAAWAVRVLGEREQRTCEDCNKTQTTAGAGLTPLIQEEYETKLTALQALVSGTQPMSVDNIEAASSDAIPLTRGVIEALRDEQDQDVLAKRLASEVALSSVLEKALTLQRTLLAGRGEPNVAANHLAQEAVSQEDNILEREIDNLKSELELRRELAGNSPMAIIQRRGVRGDASSGTFQGDTDRDRLDEIQKPRN